MTAAVHPSELRLRRQWAQEAVEPAQVEHVAACAECRAKLDGFSAEQHRFEAAISFERFAAGVERAQRAPRRFETPNARRAFIAMAAGLALVIAGAWLSRAAVGPRSRVKGGSTMSVVILGLDGARREASTDPRVPEAVRPGERVRLGISTDIEGYATAVSIDDAGSTSLGYSNVPIHRGGLQYLPDSLEFVGHGLERLVVVVTATAVETGLLEQQLKERYDAAERDLMRIELLPIDGEQFHRSFAKQ